MKGQTRFNFFVVSVICAILLPQLFREGMFMDGELYAAVSVNYARGEGTFWAPHFSKITMSFFHEQPPLLFGMLGTCFKVFGEHLLVERFYSLMMFVLTLLVFLSLWKLIFRQHDWLIRWRWMAVLIWVMIPNTTWVVIHNLEENTMGFFVILSVYCQVKIGSLKSKALAILFSLWAGCCLFLAFLTKGFPGLFPISVLPFGFLIFRESFIPLKRSVLCFVMILCTLFVLLTLSFSAEPSSAQLNAWLFDRVLNSISNVSNTSHRFEILLDLLMQLLPVFILFPILLALKKWKGAKKIPLSSDIKKYAYFFLLLAASGSLPLIVTREQRGFYLATSHPYYAFFFTILLSSFFTSLDSAYWKNSLGSALKFVPQLTLLVSLSLMLYFKTFPKRDPEKWHDINSITKVLPYGSYLVYRGDMWNDWELQTGLIRKKYVSLTSDSTKSDYLITTASQNTRINNKEYNKLNSGYLYYNVYKKK